MKIITWNVNGIRALLNKNALDWVWTQSPDVLCLQEVKAREEQLNAAHRQQLKLPFIWNAAERAGYSGVATFFKDKPLQILQGIGDPKFDCEGRVIQTVWPGFRLMNIYFPSGQRGYDRVTYKLEFYARLLDICTELHQRGENLILTGDFNTAHMPIDLTYPKANRKTSGFLPEEREWVQKYLDGGFADAFRCLYPDKVEYTWWTYRLSARERNIGWRLDYFLVSKALLPRIQDVVIHRAVPGSDHCPVELVLA